MRFAALFQQLTADLEDLLIERVGGEPCGHPARLVAQVIELLAQRLRQLREIIDNLLILSGALKGGFSLLKRVLRGLKGFNHLRLIGLVFGRFGLLQLLGYLFFIGRRRGVRPKAQAPGQQHVKNQAHVILPLH
ncbi:hypothetical protein BN135_1949 [Cronobacter muytjensii 530]